MGSGLSESLPNLTYPLYPECTDVGQPNLCQFLYARKQYLINLIKFLREYSPIHIRDICNCITEYMFSDTELIPNTLNKEEFLKYWCTVPNDNALGINLYAADHEVLWIDNEDSEEKNEDDSDDEDDHDDDNVRVVLVCRGAIASIGEYIPSETFKLKIECTFQWQSDSDFLTFTTRSDGKRDIRTMHGAWGGVEYGKRAMRVCQGWGSPRIEIEIENDKIMESLKRKSPKYEEMKVVIIDDGQSVEMTYFVDGERYHIRKTLSSKAYYRTDRNHIAIFNREEPGCTVVISSLTASIVEAN